MNERRITSEDSSQVSGEIGGDKSQEENLEHLESKESFEPSAEEKRTARITKYQEMLTAQESKLEEFSAENIREKAIKAFDTALEQGIDADMAGRLRDATQKNLEEEAVNLSGFVEEIKGNISKLESGQDDLYSEN